MSNRGSDEWWVEDVGFEGTDQPEKSQQRKAEQRNARGKLYEVLVHYGYERPKGFGKQWVKCPFHDDTHASAGVDWNTNYFTCFGCDVKGTAIDIVVLREGCSLDDAVRRIELY